MLHQPSDSLHVREEAKAAREGSTPRGGMSCLKHGAFQTRQARHVLVCARDLTRVSPGIQALTRAGYDVSVYASALRLLPRLQRFAHRVELLVVDGSAAPELAWSAALQARATFPDLALVLLLEPGVERHAEAARLGMSTLECPLDPDALSTLAFCLAPLSRDLSFERWGAWLSARTGAP